MLPFKALLTENREEQVKKFMALYPQALTSAIQKYPDEYRYAVAEVPVVSKKMEQAFLNGTYNHDGRAIKAVCKALGIKATRTAIEAFFNGPVSGSERTVGTEVTKMSPADKPTGQAKMVDGSWRETPGGHDIKEAQPTRPGFEQQAEKFRAAVEKAKAESMKKNFPNLTPPKYTFDKGQKYWRMVANDAQGAGSGRSVYCFLDTATGDILKAAGWKAPAKGPRGNIFNADMLSGVGQYGANYLKGGNSNYGFGEGVKLVRKMVREEIARALREDVR